MALTAHQRNICRLISQRLRDTGESYVAGGVALNVLLGGRRLSRDIDLFHDAAEAVTSGYRRDRETLERNGYGFEILRDFPGYKEALVSEGNARTLMEWSRDSAFRFFPLLEHDELGLTLHPFDLATNKVLALAGRLEARDWIDVIHCNDKLQPLGYLVWAACAKDPGFNPRSLLNEAKRGGRYSQAELDELAFSDRAPDARLLGEKWHALLNEADAIIEQLPAHAIGTCVLEDNGSLCRRTSDQLAPAVANNQLIFHQGTLKGALPIIK